MIFSEPCTAAVDRLSTMTSVVTAVALCVLSTAGFSTLEKQDDVLDQYYLSVLCVLGGLAGVVLFLAEFNFGWFYRLFGVAKTRVGRFFAYAMVGTIVLLWATEDTGVTELWPGYTLAALCFLSAVFHGIGACALSQRDHERRMWATQGRERIEAPVPDSAV